MSLDAIVDVYQLDEQILVSNLTRVERHGWLESDWFRLMPVEVDDATLGEVVLEAMYPAGERQLNATGRALYPQRLGVPSEGMVLNRGRLASLAQRDGGPLHVRTMNSQGSKGAWERSRGDFRVTLETPDALALGRAVRQALAESHRIALPSSGHT